MNRKQWLDGQIGHRFGQLVVLGKGELADGETVARVKCDCGVEKAVSSNNLKKGRTRSCGCTRLQVIREKSTKHGFTQYPEYHVWQQIIYRCTLPRHASYHLYGGRGISVCERWQKFESFLADMGRRPSSAHSIDRYPDQNGNYELGNCRWATAIEQQNNVRSNRLITHGGETLSVAQWARRLGIKPATLAQRLDVGTPLEAAFQGKTYQGQKHGGGVPRIPRGTQHT